MMITARILCRYTASFCPLTLLSWPSSRFLFLCLAAAANIAAKSKALAAASFQGGIVNCCCTAGLVHYYHFQHSMVSFGSIAAAHILISS
jgi:hypothetical protein